MYTAFVLWRRDLESSYLCLWLLSSHRNRQNHSQILSLFLTGHPSNHDLYLHTVGADGDHEILKSAPFYSPPLPSPLLHPPPFPLTSYAPSHTFPSVRCIAKLPANCGLLCAWRSLVSNKFNIPLASELQCTQPLTAFLKLRGVQLCLLFTFSSLKQLLIGDGRLRNTSFTGSWPACQTNTIHPCIWGKWELVWEINKHCILL